MATDADFEGRVLAFERAWRRGETPAIEDFLAGSGPGRRRLLDELVCLDLEYRSRATARAGSRPPGVEEYAREFPELGPPSRVSAELIAEEYHVRHRWGDRPGHAEFVRRFGSRPGLTGLLRRIDDELRDETEDVRDAVSGDPRELLDYGDILLRRMIGAGGFGKVYVADLRGTDGPVAVKFLRKSFWRWPHAVERFLAEAEIVARLRHAGIVAVHGSGRTPAGGPFFVMDLVDGPDLGQVLRSGPVAVADAIRWAAQTAEAVAHAHENGIVHCDLKPSNLLLGPDGRVRVTDFGLARSAADIGHAVGGTVGFMAPEQLDRNLGPVGPATDVYGLGAVLFALLTGRPPGAAAEPIGEAFAVEALPAGVAEICSRCLAERPGDRYPDVAGLLRTLETFR